MTDVAPPQQTEELPIVIIGAGHAGVQVAAGLRVGGWTGPVVMIDEQHGSPYERPPLSKEVLAGEHIPGAEDDNTPLLRKHGYYDAKDILHEDGVKVTDINLASQHVQLDNAEPLHYQRLVIASGSRSRQLPVPGGDLPGVLSLRTAADALQLRAALVPGARVVIIGAGFIGMEVAATAAKKGCEVTVLEFQDRVMKRVTSEPVSQFYQDLHAQHGVRFVFGAAVTEIRGNGHAEQVITADGSSHPADVVIAGIGVVPNQELAQKAGIECRDGIMVDATGRTSDPNVYAAGDVTRFLSDLYGGELRLECLQNATHQADAVVDALLGRPAKAPEVPWFWTVQYDARLQIAGVMRPEDDAVVRGEPTSGKFSVCYLRDGKLAAIDTVGGLSDFRTAKKLIAERAPMDPERVRDTSLKLAECVARPVT